MLRVKFTVTKVETTQQTTQQGKDRQADRETDRQTDMAATFRTGQYMILSVNWCHIHLIDLFRQKGKQKSADWYRFTALSDNVSI